MESFYWYKGYGIRYVTFGGTTTVQYCGMPIREFHGLGEIDGDKKAREYIDKLVEGEN